MSVMARSGWLQRLRDDGEGAKTEWGAPVSKVAGKAKRRLEGREERIDEKGCPRPLVTAQKATDETAGGGGRVSSQDALYRGADHTNRCSPAGGASRVGSQIEDPLEIKVEL